MTRIFLIRHAEAEGNIYRRMHGQFDGRITLNGYRQIEALEERLRREKIAAAYSSDLSRTMTTSGAVCRPRGMQVVTDPRLREVSVGPWEDMPFGEIERRYGQQLMDFNQRPFHWQLEGAERYEDVIARMTQVLTEIARRHDGQTVACFSHGCAIRALICGMFGYGEERLDEIGHCDNTGVALLEYDDGKWSLIYKNDNGHLPEEISTLARQNWWKKSDSTADHNVWFTPMGNDGEQYIKFRMDAWRHIYGRTDNCDGPGFLRDARSTCGDDPNALVYAMLGNSVAGMVQLNIEKGKADGAGYIPFIYLREQYRNNGLGVQLIGHAVSFFRALGRTKLQLSVSPENNVALRFYDRLGFQKTGHSRSVNGKLYIMEMGI